MPDAPPPPIDKDEDTRLTYVGGEEWQLRVGDASVANYSHDELRSSESGISASSSFLVIF